MAHAALSMIHTSATRSRSRMSNTAVDSEQSWLAMIYRPQGPGPFPPCSNITAAPGITAIAPTTRPWPKGWRPAVWWSSPSTSDAAASIPTHRPRRH